MMNVVEIDSQPLLEAAGPHEVGLLMEALHNYGVRLNAKRWPGVSLHQRRVNRATARSCQELMRFGARTFNEDPQAVYLSGKEAELAVNALMWLAGPGRETMSEVAWTYPTLLDDLVARCPVLPHLED